MMSARGRVDLPIVECGDESLENEVNNFIKLVEDYRSLADRLPASAIGSAEHRQALADKDVAIREAADRIADKPVRSPRDCGMVLRTGFDLDDVNWNSEAGRCFESALRYLEEFSPRAAIERVLQNHGVAPDGALARGLFNALGVMICAKFAMDVAKLGCGWVIQGWGL